MAGPEGPAYMRKDGYFMKAMKRRLLSLLLAMAMVCSLVPSALAGSDDVSQTLQSISISGAKSVEVGKTITLTATCTPNNLSPAPTIKWTSDTTSVATVAETTGIVTGVAQGTAKITATAEGTSISGTYDISVTNPASTDIPVESVTITGAPTGSVQPGTTVQLSATVVPSNATTPGVTWKSNNSKVTVDNTGTVTIASDATGSATITATSNGKNASGQNETATCTITINSSIPATGIQLAAGNKKTVTVGEKNIVWTAVLTPNNSTDDPVWTSSDSSVATIDPKTGAITALKAGTTTITATISQTIKDSAILTVEDAAPTIKATLSAPNPSSIYSGGTPSITTTMLTIEGDAAGYTADVIATTGASSVIIAKQPATNTWQITAASNVAAVTTVTLQATLKKAGAADIKSNSVTVTVSPSITFTASAAYGSPNNTITYLDNWTDNNNAGYRVFGAGVSAKKDGLVLNKLPDGTSFQWSLNNKALSGATSTEYTLYTYTSGLNYSNQQNILRFDVLYGGVIRASVEWDVRTGYAANTLATATVSTATASYALGDVDDAGKASIVSQLESYFYSTANGRYGLAYVSFGSVRDGNNGSLNATVGTRYYADRQGSGNNDKYLADVVFYPGTAKTTATFPVTFYYYTRTNSSIANVSGNIIFNITEDTVSGDIPYTASIGDDVYFDIGDFEDFYYTKTSRGTLDRVTFTMPSGGYLYSDRSRLSASNATCYVSPRSTENDLSSVYFSPSGTTASKATTVRVGFTAYGNRSNVSGTVAITYLNGAAKDISYSTVGGSVTLDPQDFIDAYKEVTGKTAPSSLTIQFQEVPANGTLTYTGGSRDVDLTRSNVRSNKYSTKTSGTYRLNQLTYTGTKGKDTVAYIAYSGSAAQFTGNVVFNGTAAVPTDVVVTYGSTGGQAVVFSQNDFIRANSVMSNAVKVRFVTPANGTLTMNGSNAAGIDVAASLLGSVTYKPKAGFNNNTDRITFVAYDSRNQLVASGTVNITVVGNTGTTTTPGGVTSVDEFKDVPNTQGNAWYRNNLDALVKRGVITGKGNGIFDPNGTVTYGEALKMVLEACGHTATAGTGSQWAINYKNLAVSNGWISSSIDLNAPISRNAIADLTGKVLGVSPATSGSPFADSASAYAVALYYTTPQIFKGNPNNGGKPLFKGESSLSRAEVCVVIYQVMEYHTQHTTDVMPDGI